MKNKEILNIRDFEKFMQREEKKEKKEDLEEFWNNKSEWFLKEQRKNKTTFQIDLFLN